MFSRMKNNEEGLCHTYPGDTHANLSWLIRKVSRRSSDKRAMLTGPTAATAGKEGQKEKKQKTVMKKSETVGIRVLVGEV